MTVKDKSQGKKATVDKALFFIPLGIVIIFCALVALFPEGSSNAFNKIFGVITGKFGWALQWFFFANTLIMVYLAFSKYGNKRLGHEKPEFSTPVWLGMLFAAGTSGVAIYWGFSEWFQYATAPPFGAEPLSREAMTWASTYSFFHWGPSAYGLYATVAVVFGFFFFVKREETNRPSTACTSVIGEKNAKGFLGKVIDIVYMMGIIGAVSAAIGLSTPLISAIIVDLFNIEYTLWIDAGILVFFTIFFVFGVYGGLQKSMKTISNIKLAVVIGLLAFVFLIGPKSYMLNTFTDSMGVLVNDYFKMMFASEPHTAGSFPQTWTIFFFAWWSAYALNTGIFLARISRGRTIRQLVLGATGASCVGCWLHFITLGYYGMNAYETGLVDVISIFQNEGVTSAIIAIIKTMPLATVVLVVMLGVMAVSTVTVINSAAYTLSIVSTNNLPADEEPARWNRIFWAIALGALGLVLIFIGGLGPIQTISLSTGILTMLIIIVIFVAFFKYDGKKWDEYMDRNMKEDGINPETYEPYETVTKIENVEEV